MEHWVTIQNIQAIADTTNYITDNGLDNYEVLAANHDKVKSSLNKNLNQIKAMESEIAEMKKKIEVLDIYRERKALYKSYSDKLTELKDSERPSFWGDGTESKSQKSRREYYNKYSHEIRLYKDSLNNLNKYFPFEQRINGQLPKIKDLRAELNVLYAAKNALYEERDTIKAEHRELSTAKRNLERIMNPRERGRDKSRGMGIGED